MKSPVMIVMGSKSDLPIMKDAAKCLDDLEIGYKMEILSAHRTPELLSVSCAQWEKAGINVVIAGAGGAAHLPGMLASFTVLPIIGVPVRTKSLNGLDSLLSIAQMPKGIPVAAVAIDNAFNAGLLAARILAQGDSKSASQIKTRVKAYFKNLNKIVLKDKKKLKAQGWQTFLKHL